MSQVMQDKVDAEVVVNADGIFGPDASKLYVGCEPPLGDGRGKQDMKRAVYELVQWMMQVAALRFLLGEEWLFGRGAPTKRAEAKPCEPQSWQPARRCGGGGAVDGECARDRLRTYARDDAAEAGVCERRVWVCERVCV